MSTTSGLSEELLEKYPVLQKWVDDAGYREEGGGREEALVQYVTSALGGGSKRASPAEVLAIMDDFASKVDFLINIGPHKADILSDLIAKEKPTVLVECGGYVGYSAILFGDAMRKIDGQARVWSLEFSEEYAKVARELIRLAGLDDIVTVVVGPAAESLEKLKSGGEVDHIDMFFLDHVEALYVQDFKVAEELGLLKPGACVVADNVVKPGAPEYREHVRAHPGLQSWGVRGLIIPGDMEDELEISKVL